MKRIIVATSCLGMVLCFQTSSMAANSGPTAIKGFHQTEPKGLFAGEHKVVAVYVNSAAPSVSIPANTTTTVDQATVKCPNPTCTLSITAMEQVGPNSTAQASWSIPVEVDGKSVDGGPSQGPFLPTQYQVGNWQGNVSVTKGVHTITWQTYGEGNYVLREWADTATILSP